jgi:hypothetical protein
LHAELVGAGCKIGLHPYYPLPRVCVERERGSLLEELEERRPSEAIVWRKRL